MNKQSPYGAYRLYLALKKHFTTKYDYHRYSGKITAKKSSFEKRRDKYFFEKLARKFTHDELESLLVSNFIVNPNLWIGDIANAADATDVNTQRIARLETLSWTYSEELKMIKKFIVDNDIRFMDLLIDNKNNYNHPWILKFLLREYISIETFVILDSIGNMIKILDNNLADDEVWQAKKLILTKYRPFLEYDFDKFKTITTEILSRKHV